MQVENRPYAAGLFQEGNLEPTVSVRETPVSVRRALAYGSAHDQNPAVLKKLQRTAVKEMARAVDRERYKIRSKTEKQVSAPLHAYNERHTLQNYQKHLYQLLQMDLDGTTPPTNKMREVRSDALIGMAIGTRVGAVLAATTVGTLYTFTVTPFLSGGIIKSVVRRGSPARKTYRILDFLKVTQEHVARKDSSTESIAVTAINKVKSTLGYIRQKEIKVGFANMPPYSGANIGWGAGGGGCGGGGCGGGGGGGGGGGCGG